MQKKLKRNEKIILCGLGNVGIKTYHLFRNLGYWDIVVINLDTIPEWKNLLEKNGTPLFEEDIRDTSALIQAGIKSATILIATTNSDRANLSCALDAQKLNPGIKTVVRVHSEELCDSLETSLDLTGAFNAKAIAAPLFSVQTIGEHILGFYDDQACESSYVLLDSRKCLHTHQEILALGGKPIFEIDDHQYIPLSNYSFPDEKKSYLFLAPVSQQLKAPKETKNEGGELKKSVFSITKTLLNPDFQIKFLFGLLILLISNSILIFHWALGMSFVDSIYFAITIVSTVGFGDHDLSDAPIWIKFYGCLLMLSGPALIATVFSLITDFILSNRLQPSLGLKKLPKRDHIVVVGDTILSHKIANKLTKMGFKSVLVTGENVAGINGQKNVYYYKSSSETTDYLKSLHLKNAHALIACSSDDLQNLNIGLQAKRVSKDLRVILRTFDTKLAERLRESLKIEEVICSAQIAADHFVSCAINNNQATGISIGNYFLQISENGKCDPEPSKTSEVHLEGKQFWITAHAFDQPTELQ